MALLPLDGTDPTVDLGVALSGTSTTSLRCTIMGMEFSEVRSFQEAMVLCDGEYVSELPGRLQSFITVNRLSTKGSNISDLSPLMVATAAANVTFTAASGCSKSGTYWLSNQSIAVQAGIVAMPGQSVFRSKGAWVSAWVTS